jgi:hypothetical protein
MIFISSVSLAQVLKALETCPEDTKKDASKHTHWYEWVFDWDDLGTITMSGEDEANATLVAPVSAIHPLRLQWMRTPEAAASAQKHDYFLDRLATGMDMGWLVIHAAAGSDRHLLDGAHRLHAAYQFGTRRPGFGVKVYWTSPR